MIMKVPLVQNQSDKLASKTFQEDHLKVVVNLKLKRTTVKQNLVVI